MKNGWLQLSMYTICFKYKKRNFVFIFIRLQTSESRLQATLNVVQKLPQSNLYNLRYIIKFLALLTKHQDVNKMSPQNLAIVIAPNLLWTPEDKSDNIG